ncbi:MAG: cbb3-type cytochrome oxidase assembly protein CcoS [Silicimonas sp.]|nr:cbb3-type cytochrome oxidase assembly protein CcoS [Silicimonas sp.]
MNILLVLVPASLILGGLALAAFIWTLRSNQYDDLQGDAHRLFIDDESADNSAQQ